MGIQEDIFEAFFEELAKAEAVDEEAIKRLRAVFGPGKKAKADEIVGALTAPVDEAGE